jgi:hypothetical protein
MISDNLYVIAGVLKDTSIFIDDPLAKKDVGTAIYLIHRAIRHLKQSGRRRTLEETVERNKIDSILRDMENDKAALNRHGIRILNTAKSGGDQ